MKSTIIHLIGPPGTGKFTIGTEVASQTGARLVDNHSIANVIFNLIAPDGVTPLPKDVWPRVAQVRAAVLDTLANVAPLGLSYVFTNFLRGEEPAEEAAFREMVAVAELRGDTFVPVVLSCRTDELVRRVVSEDRRVRMKLVDPAMARWMNEDVPPFRTTHPNVLQLDVTQTTVGSAANTIVEWAEARSTAQ